VERGEKSNPKGGRRIEGAQRRRVLRCRYRRLPYFCGVMKYLLPAVLLFASCSAPDAEVKNAPGKLEVNETGTGGPDAGTIMAADSVRIPDLLNDQYFSVAIVATEYSFRGTYAIRAMYGANDAQSEITFPRSSRKLTPLLRKGDEPFSYVVGFSLKGDNRFYDYFLVKAQKGQTEMKYLKVYQLP
jgi:hypothetical protein